MFTYFELYQKMIFDVFQHSVLDETISEAVGIVADTDKWYVGK